MHYGDLGNFASIHGLLDNKELTDALVVEFLDLLPYSQKLIKTNEISESVRVWLTQAQRKNELHPQKRVRSGKDSDTDPDQLAGSALLNDVNHINISTFKIIHDPEK